MDYDYNNVVSVGPGVFAELEKKHDLANYTKSDAEDLRRIERLLDLTEGSLASQALHLRKKECTCGRTLTFYDFILTSIVDATHPKSFIVHTLLGSKFISNRARPVRCSNCATIVEPLDYISPRYCCCSPVT